MFNCEDKSRSHWFILFCYSALFGTKHIFCSHYMHIFYCHIPFWPTPSHHTTLSLSTNTFFVKELLNHRADLKEKKGPICFPIHLVWSLFHKTGYQEDALYRTFQNSCISKHLGQEPKFIKHHQKDNIFFVNSGNLAHPWVVKACCIFNVLFRTGSNHHIPQPQS